MSKRVREGFVEGLSGEEIPIVDDKMWKSLITILHRVSFVGKPRKQKIKDVDVEVVEPAQLPAPKESEA